MLHPLVAMWMLIAIALILTLPRQKAMAPFLLAVFTIPLGQVVVLGGLHFTALRILILTVLARRALTPSTSSPGKFPEGFSAIDRATILFMLVDISVQTVAWMDQQMFIKLLGDLVDSLGGYLAIRFLVPDGESIRRAVKVLAAVCVIQGICMINEQITHINIFGLLGGVQLQTEFRSGRYRSGGVLGPLISGVVGGTLFPAFFWLWEDGKSRVAALAGLAGATAMVFTSTSSTSWMALGGSLLGLSFWSMRKQMRLVRWGLVLTLVGLHLTMNGPVWSLIEHIDLTGGSSSYHRYMLVDNCIRHFSDWWLLGYKDYNTWGFDMWDLCNQFVSVALTGGLVSLIAYVMIFVRTFAAIGKARKRVSGDRKKEWLLWCLGTSLFANLVAHFGINYTVQLTMSFFPLLAFISVATLEIMHATVKSAAPLRGLELDAAVCPGDGYAPVNQTGI